MACFAASATLIGGLVTTWLSWRLTLVLPALSLAAVPLCLPLARHTGSGVRVDLTGAAMLTVTVSTLLTIVQARTLDLPLSAVTVLASMFVLATALTVRRVHRVPDGFIPRVVVTDIGFWITVSLGVGVFGALFAAMYAVPQILAVHGWSVLQIGAALLPGAAVGALLSRLAGRLRPRASRRLLAGAAAATAVALAATGLEHAWTAVAAASLNLAAFALTQVTLPAQISAGFPIELRGMSMGLLNLMLFAGGAIGSALAGALAAPFGFAHALALIAAFPLVTAVVGGATRSAVSMPPASTAMASAPYRVASGLVR
jgi:MFS transporter, DHA2 family, metal-tetracycline-proton antiporter